MADPISASLLALGGVAGGLLPSLIGGKGSTPAASPAAPTPPPPPAPPIQQPQGTPGGAAAAGGQATPSFIGSTSLPVQQGYGTKSLLGE